MICRFVKWLREQNLPKELETFCKTILDYLSKNMAEFIKDEDEEDSSEEEQVETETEDQDDDGQWEVIN